MFCYVLFVQDCLNLEQYLQRKKNGKIDLPKQPFLLTLRNADRVTTAVYVVIEYQAIRAVSVRKGFDLIFKSFFVFDVSYPEALTGVYGFCELLHDDVAVVSKSVRDKFNLLFNRA